MAYPLVGLHISGSFVCAMPGGTGGVGGAPSARVSVTGLGGREGECVHGLGAWISHNTAGCGAFNVGDAGEWALDKRESAEYPGRSINGGYHELSCSHHRTYLGEP